MFNHKLTRPGAIACVLSVIATLSANAGQPLATDNVALVDAKACQLEAWVQSFHGGREVWALPACNSIWRWSASLSAFAFCFVSSMAFASALVLSSSALPFSRASRLG